MQAGHLGGSATNLRLTCARVAIILCTSKRKTDRGNTMARKENIYSVDKETNQIVRVSRTYLAAIKFADDRMYICTSEFQSLKKGDVMSNVVDFL